MGIIGNNFRDALLAVIEELRHTPKGTISNSELARLTFDNADPVRKWRHIRKGGHAFLLEEAYKMSTILGFDFSYLVHLAEQNLKKHPSH